ncbi:sialate O-acetylesterase [Pseudobythopirellula maris]|nr:sialate O-acetylesterase [Pseudobythopirellula maris]
MLTRIGTSVLLLMMGACAPRAGAAPLQVFVMAGQSNMSGSGHVDDLPTGYPTEVPEVLYRHSTDAEYEDWSGLKLKLTSNGAIRRWYGPEFSFGKTLNDEGLDLAIIKYSRGGTSLNSKWAPDSELRDNFFDFVDESLATLPTEGQGYEVAGFVWVQGSGDAGVEDSALEYDDNLANLINEFEGNYGEVPTIINRYHANSNRVYTDILRESQHGAADADSDLYMVNTDDLELKSDRIHFTSEMYLETGVRLANKYLQAIGQPGDYNGNGVVDAADFTLWRDTQFSDQNLIADGDGDGVVEMDDYEFWRDHFGESMGGSALRLAVPEPAAIVLLGAWAPFAVAGRARPRRAAAC